jgi:putative cardiolipin synthase
MTAALAHLCRGRPGGSGIQLLGDPGVSLAVRLALVRQARHSIDAQYYIWRNDVAGRLLLDELVAAAARGVRVRLLLDDFPNAALYPLLAGAPGISVHLFNPFRRSWGRWRNLFDLARLNRRMHNKSLTVDGVATVIGGRNIGDEYFDPGHAELAADLDVLAIGAIAADVARDFQLYWDSTPVVPLRAGRHPRPGHDAAAAALRARYEAAAASPDTLALMDEAADFTWAPVTMLSDPPEKTLGTAPDNALLLPQLLRAIGPIRRRLMLVSAYFIPTTETAALFGDLARRGVEVDILTNSLVSNNVALVHAWYAPWRRRLIDMGVRLWELRGKADAHARLGLVPRFLRCEADHTSLFRPSASALHAKTMTADGAILFVGSMNFDPRSVRFNTEMGFLIRSPVLAGQVERGLDAALPVFAWALGPDGSGGGLVWRHGDEEVRSEPGTAALRRFALWLLGKLPLGQLF